MRDFDTTIKLLIQNSATELLRQVGMGPVTEWLNVELPKVQNRRADLVGRTSSGEIIHIELQGDNDVEMPLRMAEYALFILRRYKQYPRQLVLYVGNAKLTMKAVIVTPGLSFRYDQLDIRDLDGSKLMESEHLSDNVLSVLTRLGDYAGGILRVLKKIGKLKNRSERETAVTLLFKAAQLRDLQHTVSKEVQKVPIIVKTDINDKTFGPWIRKGMEKGIKKGREEGRKEASQRILRMQLEKRFGALPTAISRRLARLTVQEADKLSLAVVDAKSLDELFPAAAHKRK